MAYKIKSKKSKSISLDIYRIEFAPDGKHFQKYKEGKIEKMWDTFIGSSEIKEQKIFNPFAKFRLINKRTGQIIGVK
jgi:hypothetical protein